MTTNATLGDTEADRTTDPEQCAHDDTDVTADAALAGDADSDGDVLGDDDGRARATTKTPRRDRIARLMVLVVLPVLAMVFTGAAAYFKFIHETGIATRQARIEAVSATRDGVTAMFTYQPGSVDTQLDAARDRLTGGFRDEYTKLIHDMAIPGAQQYHVTTMVNVPAVAVIRVEPAHVETVAFVNQNATVGSAAPTDNAFSAKVTLDKVGGRWLISGFEPF